MSSPLRTYYFATRFGNACLFDLLRPSTCSLILAIATPRLRGRQPGDFRPLPGRHIVSESPAAEIANQPVRKVYGPGRWRKRKGIVAHGSWTALSVQLKYIGTTSPEFRPIALPQAVKRAVLAA